MNFIKKIFSQPKEEPINSNADFWNWFVNHEQEFYNIVKKGANIENAFLNKLSPKLDQLKEGYFILTGMYNESTADLIITPDGNIKNIVFVEELIESAPKLDNWKFTALKPALDIKDVNIRMNGFEFSKDTISFYSNDLPAYPDEIDITVVHRDYNEKDKNSIINGTYIFLDHYLGELKFATIIDHLEIIGKSEATKELVPIEKLKDFIVWREKEFIEKYEGIRTTSDEDSHSILEATLKSGRKLIAVINTDLLKWDAKASHPWILTVEIKYEGEHYNGLPDTPTYNRLEEIEENLTKELKDSEGYLYICRQSANNLREIFYACKDFRKPSKVAWALKEKYKAAEEISYDIYKDKYWRSLERFNPK